MNPTAYDKLTFVKAKPSGAMRMRRTYMHLFKACVSILNVQLVDSEVTLITWSSTHLSSYSVETSHSENNSLLGVRGSCWNASSVILLTDLELVVPDIFEPQQLPL